MICEDLRTSQRALNLYERLVFRLARDFRFSQSLWIWDKLRGAGSQEVARPEVMRANMLVLALHGEGPLPAEIRSWLESCVQGAIAMVVLFDHPAERPQAAATRDSLRELAWRSRMDLFIHSAESEAELDLVLPKAVPRYGLLPAQSQLLVAHNSSQHWGINE